MNLDALVLQLSHRGKAVHRVPCETDHALGDDEINFPGKGIGDHRFESLALFGGRCGDSLVRVYGNELTIVPAFNVVGVVIDLRLVARALVFVVGRNASISGNAAFFLCC